VALLDSFGSLDDLPERNNKHKSLNHYSIVMNVYFGSDSHGDDLRHRLVSYANGLGYKSKDLGADVDFPVIAQKVAKRVLKDKGSVGVLMCGTGQGVAIAANRHCGIRAALCNTVADTKQAREHLDANILTLGADRIKG
jgi:ribose 5-phosphate isomerase B